MSAEAGRTEFDVLIESARRADAGARWHESIELYHRAAAATDDPELGAYAYTNAGISGRRVGYLEQAVADLTCALGLREGLPETLGLGETRLALGNALVDRGDLEESLVSLEDARRIFGRFGAIDALGHSLNAKGRALALMGDLAQANALFSEALASETSHEVVSESLNNLALLRENDGDLEGAASLLTRDQEACRDLNDVYGEGVALLNRGRVSAKMGESIRASCDLKHAIELLSRAGASQQVKVAQIILRTL